MQHVVAGQGREMLQQSFHTSSFFGFWSSELLWPLSPGFLRFWPDVAAAAAVACLPKLLTNQMALECWRDSRGNCLKRKCAPFAHVAAAVANFMSFVDNAQRILFSILHKSRFPSHFAYHFFFCFVRPSCPAFFSFGF